VVLAKEKHSLRGREVADHNAHFIPFSAYTRMSGVDMDGRRLRKGATDAIVAFVRDRAAPFPPALPSYPTASRATAARRWWLPTAPACWA